MRALLPTLVLAALMALMTGRDAMTREHRPPLQDVIVIAGDKLAPALGTSISDINVAVWRDGGLRAVPFQIDEVRGGELVFDEVTEEAADRGIHNKDHDNGNLDKDDQLVLMAWDLGERMPPATEVDAEKLIELKAVAGERGAFYFYVLIGGGPARSNKDYVRMEITGGRVRVETDLYYFSQPDTTGYFDELKFKHADGYGANMVLKNRTPADMRVKYLGLTGTMDFYDIIKGRTIATIDGPIRSVWRCVGGADFGVFKIKGEGGTEQHFYANRIDHPVMMDIPFNFATVLSSFTIRGTLVINPEVLPVTYYDPSYKEGIVISPKPDKEKTIQGDYPRDWFALSKDGGTLYYLVLFPPDWQDRLDRQTYVKYGKGKAEVGSSYGEMVELLTKGMHVYMDRWYVIPGSFQWGDERSLPEIAGREIKVETSEVRD